jgi:hypothetical protein
MKDDPKDFLGKKRNKENSINSNNLNNNNIINDKDFLNNYKETITLYSHSHWINKILILKNQPNHNLISSSADGLIIIYDKYPKYNPLLKMELFGESGVTNLTELKDGTIIACSFASIKHIMLLYDNINNTYNFVVISNLVICSTYVSKCIELFNEDLLCITQQNSLIFLRKNKEDENSISKYQKKDSIELLKNELCINVLQLTKTLFISCYMTNIKYDLTEDNTLKKNNNCIKFCDNNFLVIKTLSKIYATKSQNNMIKINDKFVIIGVEVCSNKINWNNNKGIALINYNYLELVSFYEMDNQISSMTFYDNFLYLGDDKGYVRKYKLDSQEMFLQSVNRIHQYNINTMEYDIISDKELKKDIFIILTGSNDQTIKISPDLV